MRTTPHQQHHTGWRRQAAALLAVAGLVLTMLVTLANPAQAASTHCSIDISAGL